MTTRKIEQLVANGRIERTLQDQIITAFFDNMRLHYPELDFELGEYEVDNSNGRTNVAGAIWYDGIVLFNVVYIENANCFVGYSNRMMAMVAIKNGINNEVPDVFLYPDECFGRTSQDLIDIFQWDVQRCSDSFYEEHKTMKKSEFEKIVNDALESKDFVKLNLLNDIIQDKI